MKKTFLVILCAILCVANVFLFAACQKDPAQESATPSSDVATPTADEATATPEATPDAATAEPTQEATAEPTEEPTAEPTEEPTAEPTQEPTQEPIPTPAPAGVEGTVAHWKFQNDSKYFSGSLNGSDLQFNDLSGNGNTLEVKTEGNGDKFDVFSWDKGSTLKSSGSSALYFGNTYDKAKEVCPSDYNSADMQWTGGTYVSGKYFSTVSSAPINKNNFENGYTMEIIFKVDESFNNNYNRYAGLFARQGILNNEPWFSMAVAESTVTTGAGALKDNLGLQLVQIAKNSFQVDVNAEQGSIGPEEWVHYMVTSKNGDISIYINGELVSSASCNGIGDSGFGWDVGAGRKDFTGQSVKNPAHPEGGIRRLFCGTISEIRVVDHAITVEDSLYSKAVNN